MADSKSSAQAVVSQDLRPAPEVAFDWTDGQRLSSLKKLHGAISEKIDVTAEWYMQGKKWRRKFGRLSRVAAMVLATLAAAQPTLLRCIDRRTACGRDRVWLQFSPW
jgi:hypothetical protein